MNVTLRRRRVRSDALLLWSASILALAAGYYVAFVLLGAAIDLQHGLTARVSTVALANAEVLAQSPVLEGEERAIDQRLNALQLRADKPTTVARFIHAAAQVAATQGVDLIQIDERSATNAPQPPAAPSGPEIAGATAFEAIPLDVTLRGSYRALLAAIRELALAPVTVQIEVAAIERNALPSESGANNALTARLHVVVQHLADFTPLAAPNRILPEDTTIHARPF